MYIKTKYLDNDCIIKRDKYLNGQNALLIIDKETNQRLMTASVSIPGAFQMHYEVFIKNYSENEGVLEALVSLNVLEDLKYDYLLDFASARVCRIRPEEEWIKQSPLEQ